MLLREWILLYCSAPHMLSGDNSKKERDCKYELQTGAALDFSHDKKNAPLFSVALSVRSSQHDGDAAVFLDLKHQYLCIHYSFFSDVSSSIPRYRFGHLSLKVLL